jgi:hypothetical protein
MEKRNLIEDGRTPHMDKQADADTLEKRAVDTFASKCVTAQPTGRHCPDCGCDPCITKQ